MVGDGDLYVVCTCGGVIAACAVELDDVAARGSGFVGTDDVEDGHIVAGDGFIENGGVEIQQAVTIEAKADLAGHQVFVDVLDKAVCLGDERREELRADCRDDVVAHQGSG